MFNVPTSFNRATDQWLNAMRLPSAADIDALHKRLEAIESRLAEMSRPAPALPEKVAAAAPVIEASPPAAEKKEPPTAEKKAPPAKAPRRSRAKATSK